MEKFSIILVSDDMSLRESIMDGLRGHEWTHVLTPQEAQEKSSKAQYDLIILDIHAGSGDMAGALRILTSRGIDAPVVAIVPEDRMDIAAEVISGGALDYALSPISPDRLSVTVNKAAEAQALLKQILLLKPRVIGQEDHPQPVALIREIARSTRPTLIRGDVGSGVDIVAKALHFNSVHHDGPFVEVHCSTLPQHLLESEIFGYEKGAIAGGMVHKSGQAELAAGGTLYLGNVDSLGLGAQARMVQCLQEGMLTPMGSEFSVPWEATLIAGAEADLAECIRARTFREDLYALISRTVIHLPPLKERKEDIPGLINYYLEKYRRLYRRGPIIFSETILKRLSDYPWPGNLRELEKTIERYVVQGVMPSPEVLPSVEEVTGIEQLQKGPKAQPPKTTPLRKAARTAERELIINTLRECNGNKKMAARALKVSYKTLFNKLHEYNIISKTDYE